MAANTQGIGNLLASSSVEPRFGTMKVHSAAQNGSSTETSTSIAANDFLALLVTEMKNQDPTATTDPNEYVNQLVQVNSLQQLISINETLQKATTVSPSTDLTTRVETARPSRTAVSIAEPTGAQASEAAVRSSAGDRDLFRPMKSATRVATALTGK